MQKVNCNNDVQMVAERIRPPKLSLDQSLFRKTEHERRVLKLQKRNNKPSETGALFKEFLPYLMGEKEYTLNLGKFIAKGLGRIAHD
jgi:hypothetical protein